MQAQMIEKLIELEVERRNSESKLFTFLNPSRMNAGLLIV